MYAITRQLFNGLSTPEHIATRHDVTGVYGTLNDLDVDASSLVGLAQMRVGEVLTTPSACADGFRYSIEREA